MNEATTLLTTAENTNLQRMRINEEHSTQGSVAFKQPRH